MTDDVAPALDLEALEALVEQRYISKQKHEHLDLYIYNYTPKTQFERYWTPETRACRGLMLDSAGTVVQRPLAKFFNLEEHVGPLPEDRFDVYEKMDGSLGILYRDVDGYSIATRGSFTSSQARWATTFLRERFRHVEFRANLTYLFEIIVPWNRIVVDYGDTEDLVLLSVVETATGREVPPTEPTVSVDGMGEVAPREAGLTVVKSYDGLTDLYRLVELQEENREGFVVHFPSTGLRLKIKFHEYVRLHRLITGVTERHVWEQLRDGLPIEKLMVGAPDEYQRWVTMIADGLRGEYARIETECRSAFKDLGDRKQNALYYQTCSHSAVLFKMLDGRPYDEIIWKLLRPIKPTPFKIEV